MAQKQAWQSRLQDLQGSPGRSIVLGLQVMKRYKIAIEVEKRKRIALQNANMISKGKRATPTPRTTPSIRRTPDRTPPFESKYSSTAVLRNNVCDFFQNGDCGETIEVKKYLLFRYFPSLFWDIFLLFAFMAKVIIICGYSEYLCTPR